MLDLVLKSLSGIVSSADCNSAPHAFQKANADLKTLCKAVRERNNDLKALRAASVPKSNSYP